MIRLWRWLVGGADWNYVSAIQSLKSETPLRLPAVKPLKAIKSGKKRARKNVADFRRGRL